MICMEFFSQRLTFWVLLWWTLVIRASSTSFNSILQSDRFVYETFVELKHNDSSVSQAELRLSCCESATDVAAQFCKEFTVDKPACTEIYKHLAEQAAISQRQCVCDKNVKVPEKIYTFPIDIQENDKPDLGLRLAVYPGDYQELENRIYAVCDQWEIDDDGCENIGRDMEEKVLQYESKYAMQNILAAVPSDIDIKSYLDILSNIMEILHQEKQMLQGIVEEKAKAYTSIRVNSKVEKMMLEAEIQHLKMTLASEKQHLKQNDSRVSTNTNGSSSSLSIGEAHGSSFFSFCPLPGKSAEHVLKEVTASAEISDVDEVNMDQPLNSRRSKKIPRIHASNLTYEKYLEYASQTIPLIITGLRDEPNSPGLPDWSLENIYRLCGNKQVSLKRKINKDPNHIWGGIEAVAETALKEFINDIVAKPRKRDGWPKDMTDLYLHDESVPHFCPELLEMYHVPRFFTYDLMQVLSSSYRKDAWPSLFIGGKSTASSLHTDWGSTAAWMGLLKGRKHWVIAKPNQNALLFDQTHPNDFNEGIFASDLINPDFDKFPLLSQVDYYEDILHAGELIFIPADCPHQVQNLELTVAIAANLVDAGSIDRFQKFATEERDGVVGQSYNTFNKMLEDLSGDEVQALLDPKTRKSPKDLSYVEFKNQQWTHHAKKQITTATQN